MCTARSRRRPRMSDRADELRALAATIKAISITHQTKAKQVAAILSDLADLLPDARAALKRWRLVYDTAVTHELTVDMGRALATVLERVLRAGVRE